MYVEYYSFFENTKAFAAAEVPWNDVLNSTKSVQIFNSHQWLVKISLYACYGPGTRLEF